MLESWSLVHLRMWLLWRQGNQVYPQWGNQVKMRALGWALLQNNWCPDKKKKSGQRKAHRENVTWTWRQALQAKKAGLRQILLSQPTEATNSAWFCPSSFQNCETINLLFKTLSAVLCYSSSTKLHTLAHKCCEKYDIKVLCKPWIIMIIIILISSVHTSGSIFCNDTSS